MISDFKSRGSTEIFVDDTVRLLVPQEVIEEEDFAVGDEVCVMADIQEKQLVVCHPRNKAKIGENFDWISPIDFGKSEIQFEDDAFAGLELPDGKAIIQRDDLGDETDEVKMSLKNQYGFTERQIQAAVKSEKEHIT